MRHPFHLAGLVAGDHATIETLFTRIEAGQGDRAALFAHVRLLLATHGVAEEQVLYPQLRAAGIDGVAAGDLVEHHRLKEALVDLDHHAAGTDAGEAAMRRVIDLARPHVEAERARVEELADLLGEARMEQLGRAFLDASRRAPSHAHPHAPVTPVASAVVGGPAAMFDRLRDALTGRHDDEPTDVSGLLDVQAQQVVDAAAALTARAGRMIHLLDPSAARQLPTLVDAVASLTGERRRPGRQGAQNHSSEGRRGQSTRGRHHAVPDDVLTEEAVIDGPAGPLRLRIHRPAAAGATSDRGRTPSAATTDTRRLPVYLHVHGGGGLGGGVVGDATAADGPCRAIARHAGCLAVAVDHRLAPEYPFPAGHDDVLAVLRWAMSDAATWGADPRRVVIGGEGIGATMATAAAVQVRATGRGPMALVLVTPMTSPSAAELPSAFPSWREAADARPMSSAVARWCLGHLVRDAADLDDPRLSLLRLPDTTLARFPPTLVLTAERDPWRDEGAAFAAALRAAGVDVEHTRYDGVMHGFFVAADAIDRAAIAQTQVAGMVCRAFDPDHLEGVLPTRVPHIG